MSKRELRWFTVVSFLLGVAGIVLVILVNNLPIYFVYGSSYLAFTGGLTCLIAGLLLLFLPLSCWDNSGTWFALLLVTLIAFFPLSVVLLLLYLFIGPEDHPEQPAQPAQSPAYVPYYPPHAPAPLPHAASQPALPAQSYEQSLHYPPYVPSPLPHAASEKQLQ